MDPLVSAKMQEIAEREIAGEKAMPWIMVGLVVFLLMMAPIMCPNRPIDPSSYRTSSTATANGTLYANERGDVWVVDRTGRRREPTEAERQEATFLLIGLARKPER